MSYHNTTNETGETLKRYQEAAMSLEQKVYDLFLRNPGVIGNATKVMKAIGTDQPLTSYRRAMSDLTKQGKLVKTDIKRMGAYGRSTFCWKLNTEYNHKKN